jgi:ATP-dependent exoDNAse (exonuclease V) beta subunit
MQIAAATQLYREVEFLLAWPPCESTGDGRYLQGYIDCLYQDHDGRLRIVDYKSNDVSADKCAPAAQRYEMQLAVYALATEQATGQPIGELVVYFLRPSVEHVFIWDDAARRRGIELVNAALEANLKSPDGPLAALRNPK